MCKHLYKAIEVLNLLGRVVTDQEILSHALPVGHVCYVPLIHSMLNGTLHKTHNTSIVRAVI